jgi:hypothetical protein
MFSSPLPSFVLSFLRYPRPFATPLTPTTRNLLVGSCSFPFFACIIVRTHTSFTPSNSFTFPLSLFSRPPRRVPIYGWYTVSAFAR